MAVIRPESFISAGREKTRLDRFCYEFALGVYDSISEKLGERLVESGIVEDALAGFSVRLSKDAGKQIVDQLAGRIRGVYFSWEPFKREFPFLEDETVDEMIDAVLEAWDELLEVCESCPNACITRRNEPAPMFDCE